jgi:hypothetical protein
MARDLESVKKTLESLFEKFEKTKKNEDLGEIKFQINYYIDEERYSLWDLWDSFAKYKDFANKINNGE